ncbi:MAG: hypothetical protein K5857_09010 [Lachnospiraceae bacterium]|nr:hypothetical protein [Lachnospiraceae bacterium]
MDNLTVYDKAYNKAKLALKLHIDILIDSYRRDLAHVFDDEELTLIIQSKIIALNQLQDEINDI